MKNKKTVNEKCKNDQIRFHEAIRNIENGTRKVAGRMKITFTLDFCLYSSLKYNFCKVV